jgi:hypothetical protein
MAEHQPDRQPEANLYGVDPRNPPTSVPRRARRVGLAAYVGPWLVLGVVVAIALIYWANRDPVPADEQTPSEAVATSGDREAGRDDTPPKFDSTADELKYRGGDSSSIAKPGAITRIRQALSATESGQAVNLSAVEVAEVSAANRFWIHEGNDRIEVVASDGVPALRAGDRVHVTGLVEKNGATSRIRADRVGTN